MSRAPAIAIVLLSIGAAASCRKDEPTGPAQMPAGPSEQVPAATSGAQASAPTHEYMQEHFDAVVRVRDALIAGEVEAAKANALWIAEHEPDVVVATWRESVDDMRQWATEAATASGIEPTAAAAAELARACGKCHTVHGVSPDLGTPEPPVAASGAVPHMRRHQWAADRLWEGLIGPSNDRWLAGGAELAETPLASDELLANLTVGPRVAELAAAVHALGTEAREATAWDARAATYGRFLATCATCHRAMPPAPE